MADEPRPRSRPREVRAPELEIRSSRSLEVTQITSEFLVFCSSIIEPAIAELGHINDENNRRILQKLVYVHLVDKFDLLIDRLLVWSSTNSPTTRTYLLKEFHNVPVDKQILYDLLLKGDLARETIEAELRDASKELKRDAHVRKVQLVCDSVNWTNIRVPLVYPEGKLALTNIRKATGYPNSILGYADYLYARRNGVVHGDGIRYLPEQHERLKREYNTGGLPMEFKISLATVKNASQFYSSFISRYVELVQRM